MDLSPNQFREATRKDGWSPEHKARFLALLAEAGNVRLAARRCGLSAQSAYVQRRRDPLFARGWAAALVLALEHGEQILADRAIDGVEEQIFYRGELIGTRRRYDSRLLLAHLARLDRQAEAKGAAADAGRFDEIVALVAGAEPPKPLAGGGDGLPPARAEHAAKAAEEAKRAAVAAEFGDEDPDEGDEYCDALAAVGDAAHAEADARWLGWRAQACAAVDRLADGLADRGEFVLQDSINPSTSAALDPPRNGEVAARSADGGAEAYRPNAVPAESSRPLRPFGAPPRSGEDLLAARTRIVYTLAWAGADHSDDGGT